MIKIRLKVSLSKRRAKEYVNMRSDCDVIKMSSEKDDLNAINVAEREHNGSNSVMTKLNSQLDILENQLKTFQTNNNSKDQMIEETK